jgi:hypothetical protein
MNRIIQQIESFATISPWEGLATPRDTTAGLSDQKSGTMAKAPLWEFLWVLAGSAANAALFSVFALLAGVIGALYNQELRLSLHSAG